MRGLAAAIVLGLFTLGTANAQSPRDLYDATHIAGTIAVMTSNSSFQMSSGLVVFMHRGTVINPRGIKLRAGMEVAIIGTPDGTGRFNANEVDAGAEAMAQGYLGSYYRSTHADGRIESISGETIRLAGGRIVVLQRSTTISPRGASLAVGKHLHVIGQPRSDGGITADRLDVSGG
jgi:hypothetical protein